MPQPKLKESEIFAVPPEEWTPEFLLILKEAMRKRIATLREVRRLLPVAESQPQPTKKSKKKSLADKIGLDVDPPKEKPAKKAGRSTK